MELTLTAEAIADLRATRAYYDAQEPGLSRRFLGELDSVFGRLQAFPRSATPVAGYANVRRALVRGFPFAIFYRQTPDRIDILRVLHTARRDAVLPPIPDIDHR